MMTDFTKEELEEIIDTFDFIEKLVPHEWKTELKDKIQSMIDNYCEHEISVTMSMRDKTFVDCTKCGKRL